MPSADGVLVAAIVLVLTGAGLPEVATLQNGHRTGTGFLAVLVTGEAAPRAAVTWYEDGKRAGLRPATGGPVAVGTAAPRRAASAFDIQSLPARPAP
jgi:hypothetical protein